MPRRATNVPRADRSARTVDGSCRPCVCQTMARCTATSPKYGRCQLPANHKGDHRVRVVRLVKRRTVRREGAIDIGPDIAKVCQEYLDRTEPRKKTRKKKQG